MRKKWICSLLSGALLLILTTGCTGSGEVGESYRFYYPTTQAGPEGQAVAWEERQLPANSGPEELLQALLRGPEGESLRSPFPRQTALRRVEVYADGTAEVDLTEPYGGLSGVEQTLADSIITLTLCQIEEIGQVHIVVEGLPRPYRDRVLSPEDMLLDNGGQDRGERTVWLWFPGEGGLAREERSITLSPGDNLVVAALQALAAGPEDHALQPLCPQGSTVTLRQWEHRYALDLSQSWFGPEGDELWLPALLATLAEVDTQAQVTITAEGKPLDEVAGIDVSGPVWAGMWLPKEVMGEGDDNVQ